ncbi:putative Histone-binding protein RBBP4 or subunit C of CAF1 complex [Leishmania shawi]|uniref:Histone-binding protein RBBP4 or subunit C of CAF1 complex n=1 Tax=Leishmania shawi TaxID=5680 RepID=A0AAW3BCA2_9TRYP
MKRGAKRTSRDGEDAPGARIRTKDAKEMLKEEEALRQRELEEAKRQVELEDDDGSWEDDEGDVEDFEDDDKEEIIEASDENDDEYAEFQKESSAHITKGLKSISFKEAGQADSDDDDETGGAAAVSVWRGDIDGATVGEAEGCESMKLEFSNKAYDAFFQLRTEYPCLSFDVVKDNKENHTKYPLSTVLVCGTQADEQARNELLVLYVTNMCRTKYDVASDNDSEEDYIGEEDDSEEDEDDAVDEDVNDGEPVVHHRTIKHYGTANRVRCCPQNNPASGSQLVAVWSDAGHVQVFDIGSEVRALTDFSNWSKEQAQVWKQQSDGGQGKKAQPLKFCTPSTSHKTEGYGLDWSSVQTNVFASGDCAGSLFVWQPTDDGRWKSAASSIAPGAMSIEEIQWSPTQTDVLITTRAGGAVEVWDTRDMRACKISFQADSSDINVADWNRARQASHLLVTGAESGAVSVWDLRRIATPEPIQRIALHKKAITSVEFAPHNESVLSVLSDDGCCTLWDLSLERDVNEEQEAVGELFSGRLKEYPDQLMFHHQGLVHPKEAHWHMQVPGLVVTTDYEGLHLFRPINWKSLMR